MNYHNYGSSLVVSVSFIYLFIYLFIYFHTLYVTYHLSNILCYGSLANRISSELTDESIRSLLLNFVFCYFWFIDLLSPAFSKKSGGTLFSVFRGAWCVLRGAWFRIFSRYLVPLTPPTVFVRSFWNLTGSFKMVWRYACVFFSESWNYFFITFYTFWT